MSKAIKSDGSVERSFKELVKNFNSYTKKKIDTVVEAMDTDQPGSTRKLDQCKKYTLMEFSFKYYKRFKTRCLRVDKFVETTLKQAHTSEDYLKLHESKPKKSKSGSRDPADVLLG
jgi:hypothetical protein